MAAMAVNAFTEEETAMQAPPALSRIALVAVLLLSVADVLSAHEVTYQGTVLAVEPTRLQVKTIDATSKKEQDVWFAVNKATKVKRGNKAVSYADALITKDERVVVIVDHDAETKMLATEIRLAVKK